MIFSGERRKFSFQCLLEFFLGRRTLGKGIDGRNIERECIEVVTAQSITLSIVNETLGKIKFPAGAVSVIHEEIHPGGERITRRIGCKNIFAQSLIAGNRHGVFPAVEEVLIDNDCSVISASFGNIHINPCSICLERCRIFENESTIMRTIGCKRNRSKRLEAGIGEYSRLGTEKNGSGMNRAVAHDPSGKGKDPTCKGD